MALPPMHKSITMCTVSCSSKVAVSRSTLAEPPPSCGPGERRATRLRACRSAVHGSCWNTLSYAKQQSGARGAVQQSLGTLRV